MRPPPGILSNVDRWVKHKTPILVIQDGRSARHRLHCAAGYTPKVPGNSPFDDGGRSGAAERAQFFLAIAARRGRGDREWEGFGAGARVRAEYGAGVHGFCRAGGPNPPPEADQTPNAGEDRRFHLTQGSCVYNIHPTESGTRDESPRTAGRKTPGVRVIRAFGRETQRGETES